VKEFAIFEAHENYALGVSFTGDGKTLISAGMDGKLKLWSVPDFQLIRSLQAHAHSLNSFALDQRQTLLASASTDTTVKIWSFPDLHLRHTLHDRKKTAAAVALSPEGEWTAAAFYGGALLVWDRAGNTAARIRASDKNLATAAFSADGRTLSAAGLGGLIQVWQAPAFERIEAWEGHAIAVVSLKFLKHSPFLASLGYDGALRLWSTTTWEKAGEVPLQKRGRGIAFSADERLAVIGMEGKVQLLETASWRVVEEIGIGTPAVNGMAFSPDGSMLAVGAADKKVRVFLL